MKKEPLLKALKYAFIPTVLAVVITLLTTLSLEATYKFFLSPDSFIVRFFIIVIEGVLFYYLYDKYNKELIIKNTVGKEGGIQRETDGYSSIRNLFKNSTYGDTYTIFTTEHKNIKVIKRNHNLSL